jgi:5,10-methylenetetrahydromethanopterin reductase
MTRHAVSIAFQTDKKPAEYAALAALVDQYDFDVVSVYGDLPYHPSFGPLLLMAPHVTRARLGPAGVSPARMHPVDMAANAALLDRAAPGGAYLGIVRGAWLADHGVREPEGPLQAIRESIEIVRYLLDGGEGGYAGAVYRIAPHVRAPYPLPERPVPIMVGTWGPKLCAVAAEVADEVKVGGTANPDLIPLIREYIAAGEARVGRDGGSVGIAAGAVTVVDEDGERARTLARREVALYLPVVAPLDPTVDAPPDLLDRIRGHVERGDVASAARLIPDDLLRRFAFAGTPAEVADQANALFAAGAARVEFGTPHGIPPEQGIRLIGEYVIPALRRG